MTLETALRTFPGRCQGCGSHTKTQGCACEGQALATRGMAIASAANPDDRAAVDAAIAKLAATREPFSANDARALHGIKGPVVGAAFQAAARAGLIRKVGFEPSTDPGTHAHPVATWRGRAA